MMFAGIKVIVSPYATTEVRHWPQKKRSKRLIKKLTKLRGPEITQEPGYFMMGPDMMVMHPEAYKYLKESTHERT